MRSERVRFAGSDGVAYSYTAFWDDGEPGRVSYRAAANGRKHGLTCVWVNVYDADASGGGKEVQLTSVGKDAACTDPPQPSGKAADMVKAVLGRVAALVGTHRVVLEDEADFTSDLPAAGGGGNVDVVMAEHNALVHGMTYYERRLGAVPRDAEVRAALDALNRHRASRLPVSADALARGLKGVADPWVHAMVAEAYREAGGARGTWGGLYAALDSEAARRRGGAAVVQRLYRHAVANAGLPVTTRLRGQEWLVPRTAVRSWKELVLEVTPLAGDEGTATRRRRTAASATTTRATADDTYTAQRGGAARGRGAAAAAAAVAKVMRAFNKARARRASALRRM